MTLLDFKLSGNEYYIERVYHHSPCIEHEATREEVLLWRRVKALEAIIHSLRPQIVKEMLEAIPKGVDKVWVSPRSMELLKEWALDVIRPENLPSNDGTYQEIWGSIQYLDKIDGLEEPRTIWLAWDRNLPDGVVSTERASTYLTPVCETLRSEADLPAGESDSALP